jgi:hypothetical protein
MKEIIKDKTIVEHYTVYQATDGTDFNSLEECKKYEESALGVIRSKIAKLIVYDTRKISGEDAWSIMGGCDDHDIVAVKMNTAADLDLVKHWLLLECPYYNSEGRKELKATRFEIFEEAYNNGDVLIFGMNCDNEGYFINSRQNIIDKLNSFDKPKEEDKKDV